MNPNDLSLDELRQLVRSRRAAVTAKIGRARRSKGVDLAGTQYDPRRDSGITKKYTRRQLQAALGSYEKFLSRGTQFVGDAERRPITVQDWRKYQAAEQKLNASSEERRGVFNDVHLPQKRMTYSAYRAASKADFPTAADPAVNDPYPTYNRQPSDIANVDKLKALTKSLLRRAKPSAYKKPLTEARDTLEKMFPEEHNDMLAEINKLNNKQFEYLWNISGFAHASSSWYHLSKRAKEGKAGDWLDEVGANMADEARSYIDEAKKIK